jgi:hypothetical protein
MRLSQSHSKLLRQLVTLPPNKRIWTHVPREYIDLETAGYAKIVPVGASQHLFEITEDGREALSDADQEFGVRLVLDSSDRPVARHSR